MNTNHNLCREFGRTIGNLSQSQCRVQSEKEKFFRPSQILSGQRPSESQVFQKHFTSKRTSCPRGRVKYVMTRATTLPLSQDTLPCVPNLTLLWRKDLELSFLTIVSDTSEEDDLFPFCSVFIHTVKKIVSPCNFSRACIIEQILLVDGIWLLLTFSCSSHARMYTK